MGLGDKLMDAFGGGNEYRYNLPPTIGSPNSTPQQQYQNYIDQNRDLGNLVNQSRNLRVPKYVLNFGANRQERNQQQNLIDQILAQGRGEGPNPALDQLRMTTDQNARQANALLASNPSMNSGLAARLASQNLASANQQAAGQGALMSAQQQLGAQQLGGNLLGQRIGQQSQNAIAQGQAGLGLLSARLQSEAQRRAAQQNYQNMINQVYANANNVNAGVSAQNAQTSGGYGSGLMTGVSGALGLFNQGGEVAEYLNSGGSAGAYQSFQTDNPMNQFMDVAKPVQISQGLGNLLSNAFKNPLDSLNPNRSTTHPFSPDTIPITSPFDPRNLSQGGKVSGKAFTQGNSIENDTVPAMLSPGEVVIPRTAMKNPESAHDFLDKIIQKHQGPSYKEIMKAKNHYHNMAHGGPMEKCMYCGGMA